MPIGIVFWVLMLIVLVFGIMTRSPAFAAYGWGWNWLLFVLLFLLGWKVFGFAVHA